MNRFEIHLQGGFRDDNVVIWADGKELGEVLSARTHPASGLATIVGSPWPRCCVRLGIVIPNRRLRREIHLDPAATPHLGISIDRNRIRFQVSLQPFCYARRRGVPAVRYAGPRRAVRCCARRRLGHAASPF